MATWYYIYLKKVRLAFFAASTLRMKTVLSNQTVDVPENVDVTLQGPQLLGRPRGTLWRDFNPIHAELSLLGKKKRPRGDRWWETDRNWLLSALSVVTYRTWSRESHWASVTR